MLNNNNSSFKAMFECEKTREAVRVLVYESTASIKTVGGGLLAVTVKHERYDIYVHKRCAVVH